MLTEQEEIEYLELLEKEQLDDARESFWSFCCLLAPDFYKPNREYLKTICDTLQDLFEGKLVHDGRIIRNLLMEIPPRHGKSRTLTNFAAWVLGRDNTQKIITASFNDDLAQDFSRFTRDIIAEEKNTPDQLVYSDIFDTRIKQGDAAYHKWATEGQFFNYKGTGIGGSITGRGATCFPRGTIIETSNGKQDVSTIQNGARVLSYNHGQNIFEWKRVIATKQKSIRRLIKIATIDGNSFSCTEDHRIYVIGKGYVEAKNIERWDSLFIHESKQIRHIEVYTVWERIQKGVVRIYKKGKDYAKGFLLFFRVLGETSLSKEWEKMCDVWHSNAESSQKILLKTMQAKSKENARHKLSLLRDTIQAVKSFDKVLHYGLQKRISLGANKKAKEPKLQAWDGFRKVSGRVSKEKIFAYQEERHALCDMRFKEGQSCTSQRFESRKQFGRESDSSLPSLSCNTSQVSSVTISDTEDIDVYDIQVEGNENFFANGVLVHNCLIIDDPVKDAETAYNEAALDKIWLWYSGTFLSRAEENAIQIICMTPWAKQDLGARAVDAEPENWHKISMPARVGDGMLCDELLSRERYERLKNIGDENIIAANYDMVRLDVKGQLYKGFKTYDVLPEHTDGNVGYTDTADEGNDYLCSIQAKKKGPYFYVTDVVFTQEPQEITEKQVVDSIIKTETRTQVVESNNGGRAFARNVKRILEERKNPCAVNWFHQSANKKARILTNAPLCMEYVLFPEGWGHRWNAFYLALMGYQKEGKNKHDDAPDALTGLVEKHSQRGTLSVGALKASDLGL